MMFELFKKKVFINENPLYEESVSSEMFNRDWDVKSGEWSYNGEWIYGKNPENFPGMIISKQDFLGDVMVDFVAKTVVPSTHDIDVMWSGSWNDTKNERGVAYIAGVEGWYTGKIGFEKSPEYKLNVCTPLFDFVPGEEYHIQVGSVNGHCFVRINDKLVLEITDPEPIDTKLHGKIGFEAFASSIAIKDIKVFSINYVAVDSYYDKEF